MKNTKLVVLPMLVMLGLLTSGLAYAHWSQTLYIEGSVATGDLCAKFVTPVTTTDHGLDLTCDEGFIDVRPLDKDVGSSSATIVADDKIEIELTNVYPCYYEHIAFWVKNCGTTPWKIENVIFNPGEIVIYAPGYLTLDLNNDENADVEIYWGNNFGVQVDEGEKVNISFEIHVLQDAPQGASLTFTASIVVVQWNN